MLVRSKPQRFFARAFDIAVDFTVVGAATGLCVAHGLKRYAGRSLATDERTRLTP